MENIITGEHLRDLFTRETWQDHFDALSDTLGFTLSVYSDAGKPIYVPDGAYPICTGFRSQSSDLKSRCDADCHPFILNTLTMGKPNVFKCYSKIVSFAFPIEYMGEKAVILGQGSFSSYEDFRDCMDLANAHGIDMVTIKTPLTFTSTKQAWKACRFVLDTVNRLLKNMQETVTLRKKFEILKNVFAIWDTAAVGQPETRFQDMLYNLSTLLDIDRITVLALNRQQGRYTSLYGLSKGGVQTEALSVSLQDTIVRELQSGKPFVHSTVPVAQPGSDGPSGRGSVFFFPIMINHDLEGILSVADRALKESDKQIIAGFCKQTALFIENHQLHQDLYKKFNRYAALSELTKAITPIQNYDTLLQTILDKSAELLKAEQGSLMLLDQETDNLLLEAKKGIIQGLGKIRIQRGEGIAGKVAELGEPILVENLEDDPRIRQKNRQHYKTRSFVSVPLKIEDRIIGVINLSDKTSGEVFDEEDLKLIQSFATHAAIVLERNVFYNKTEELKKLTITDHLTGLLNRRYLYERLKDELARSERYGHHLSLLMLDLDGFKYCNDTFGHLFGDKILKIIAETLLNTVRSMDIVARYGGDEFMVILPETKESMAVDIAERVRNNVANKVALPQGATETGPHSLTTSIGIVCYPDHGDRIEHLLENVDKALYRAKDQGKNRIEVYS
ncbi:MAG: diguanylate cyclase [Betaproteobacteria bacterium]